MAQNPFEFSQQFRELTERNLEQARATYGQFLDAMTQAAGMWTKGLPANDVTSGFQAVQEKAIGFAKDNAEASFALASDLASAKDVQQVMALQTQFAQQQMQTFASQAQEIGSVMTGALQGMAPKR